MDKYWGTETKNIKKTAFWLRQKDKNGSVDKYRGELKQKHIKTAFGEKPNPVGT